MDSSLINPPLNFNLSYQRAPRAYFHDYKAKGFYHLTSRLKNNQYRLSNLSFPEETTLLSEGRRLYLQKNTMIVPSHTALGFKISDEINKIPNYHPELRILRYVIMPEHIHYVVEVKETLKRALGAELAGFFSACSKHAKAIYGLQQLETLFEPFYDQIIFNYQQLDRAIKYVEDNPRRRLIKQANPDLFRTYLHLEIGGREYAAYGNIFLLRSIWLLPIRIHRRWSDSEFADYDQQCRASIDSGAVVISPFIHQAEKRIQDYAIQQGSPVIKLRDKGFKELFKPQGREFDLCAEGRLLLLAPWPHNIHGHSTAGYVEFHSMNDMAASIAGITPSVRLNLKDW